ncbi:MAG: DUF6249 domain-containing protein [Spirochaetaceae bacterium]
MDETVSTAAQVLITVIPIVGIIAGAAIAFFYLLWNHKRKLKLIEQGITPQSELDLDGFSLLTGLLATTVGAALTIFYLLVEKISYALLGGLIPLAVGVGLLLFYRIRRRTGT